MEIEIKKFFSIQDSDFKNSNCYLDINYGGDLIFKEVEINNIENDSIILNILDEVIKENNLDKDEYDIYFKRNKEWFNKFIFYKKNK